MPFIAQQTVHDVLSVASIHEVVADYVPTLKKAGSNFKAVCPFHAEKTPSFNVNPARNIFKCFGCGKGGNVVQFIIEIEKVEFPEAIRLLADRYHIAVKTQGGERDETEVLFRLHEIAERFFRRALSTGRSADRARQYASERGLTDESVERFGIGYAPPEWDALLKRLRADGFSDRDIRRSGLVVEKEDSDHLYDRFRDRLIFPIRNARGKTIAFGGRLLPEAEQKGGKYINSPETPIFKKSRHLYGLEWLDRDVDHVIVVEGYFDVILPLQHGVRGVVAPMGTAFGPEHVRIIRRFSRRCTLMLDGDAAGRAAAERGLDLLLDLDLDLGVATLPPGEDPADAVVRRGPQALRDAVAAAPEAIDFLIDMAVAGRDVTRTAERAAAADSLVERVARLGDPVRRDLLIQRISARLDVSRAALALKAGAPPAPPPAPKVEAPALEKDARTLIRQMLDRPDTIPVARERLPDGFGVPAADRLFDELTKIFVETGSLDWTLLQVRLDSPEAQAVLADAQMMPEPSMEMERVIESVASLVQRRRARARREELKRSLREAEGEEKDRIALELSRLSSV